VLGWLWRAVLCRHVALCGGFVGLSAVVALACCLVCCCRSDVLAAMERRCQMESDGLLSMDRWV